MLYGILRSLSVDGRLHMKFGGAFCRDEDIIVVYIQILIFLEHIGQGTG